MQKPKWRFTLSNEQLVILQAIISPGSVTLFVNDESIETREISGYENIIPIELYDKTFTLILHKKPIGGYDYTLEIQNGEKLVALDSEPTIAVSNEAEKVADSLEEKQGSRIPLLVTGLLLGGCLGILFVFMGIAVYESDRSRTSKITLYVILGVVTVAWDFLFVFFGARAGLWLLPLNPF